jgi:uncharacterized membrane protein YedE/YeeE
MRAWRAPCRSRRPSSWPTSSAGWLFGVGMATAGYCTGTVVAQAGEGRLDAWVGGLSGLIVGALAFGLLQPHIMPALTRTGALGRATLASLTGARPWLVLIVFGQLVGLTLYALARRRSTHVAASSGDEPKLAHP